MSQAANNIDPALHNAMWPRLVGKGAGSEPPIDLETMLKLTAAVEVDGVRFEGVDLFLSLPHTDIDSSDDDLKRLADNLASKPAACGIAGSPGLVSHRWRFSNGQPSGTQSVGDAVLESAAKRG